MACRVSVAIGWLNGVPGAANAGFVQAAEALVARFPIDLLGQLNQRVAQVDEIDQFLAEHVAFCRLSRLAQGHEFARVEALIASILAIFIPTIHRANPHECLIYGVPQGGLL